MSEIQTKKEAVYKTTGRRCGYQLPDSPVIIRPNELGIFTPSSKEESDFLDTLVKQGFVSKE